jgi:hypothetical protein
VNRTEFILVTAFVLLAAFAMGWFAHWLLHRFTRVTDGDMGEVDRLAQALHEAEEMRDQAITYLQQREAELTGHLAQSEAELRAAMDGLRDARRHAQELENRLEAGR